MLFFKKNTQATQAPSKAPRKQIDELQKLYDLDFQANQSSLREYEEAKRYYHGEQLPSDVKAELQGRGQIAVVENIYKMIVDKILGYKSESIQEVKLSGRQEQDKNLRTSACGRQYRFE